LQLQGDRYIDTLYIREVKAVFREQWLERTSYKTPNKQRELIKQIHKSKLRGHIGITKIVAQVKQHYTFSLIQQRVIEVISQCNVYNKAKTV
jgi:hypothetical protein